MNIFFSHGHTYLEENELSKAIYQILSSTIDNQLVTEGISRLIEQKRIIKEDTFYYLKHVKKSGTKYCHKFTKV